MGEIADMMLEGLLDEETGEYIGDLNVKRYGVEVPGFPVSYQREMREYDVQRPRLTRKQVKCPQCGRKITEVGLRDHIRDKHGEQS